MSPIKQVQVVVLLVIAAASLAAARPPVAWTALTPTGAEPGASGEARKVGKLIPVGQDFFWLGGWWWWTYSGELSVQGHGLAPNTTYTVYWESGYETTGGEFPLGTDGAGEGAALGGINVCMLSKNKGGAVNVRVFDPNGTLVLSGAVPF
jgi:hypothetical protein